MSFNNKNLFFLNIDLTNFFFFFLNFKLLHNITSPVYGASKRIQQRRTINSGVWPRALNLVKMWFFSYLRCHCWSYLFLVLLIVRVNVCKEVKR